MTRRRAIALLANDAGLGDDYQGSLRRGVEQACLEHDLDLRVYAGRADWSYAAAQRRVYEMMRSEDIDGIVVAAGCIAAYASLEETLECIERHCPVAICAVGQRLAHIPSVVVDNFSGASKLVEHIVGDHGRRHVAYIAGPANHEESRERVEGTRHALLRHDAEFKQGAIIHGDFSYESGRLAVYHWLDTGFEFNAILAANDDMAAGALEALRLHEIRCPNDVVVAGFDDSSQARLGDISLTTVRQPIVRAGASAVHHLIGQWQRRKLPDRLTLPTEIVIRESCGCRANDLRRGPSDQQAAREGGAFRPAELVEMLKPLLDGDVPREQFARELCRGAEAERAGKVGALAQAIDGLIATLPDAQLPIHALQRVITHLRARARDRDESALLEEAFHEARVAIGGHAYRRVGVQLLRHEQLLESMRYAWEGLATSLTLPALRDRLVVELPKLQIANAVIALHVDDQKLLPLVCLEYGMPVVCAEVPYPAEQLIPSGVLNVGRRRVLTVLPLTFKSERLGVAILELPQRLEVYALLREQIGSAIKAAQLHDAVIIQERLRVQAEEDERLTAERLKALHMVAAGVAHDLNDALGPILALPEVIQRNLSFGLDSTRSREIEEDLTDIGQAAQRAAATIRDLLVFGRSETGPKTVVDVRLLLERERGHLLGICEHVPEVSLSFGIASEALPVRASRIHLVRSITNLVINALDSIGGSGAIVVTAELRNVDAVKANQQSIPPGRYVVIAVKDTGKGLGAVELTHVLEPLQAPRPGIERMQTGLGLAIVQRFVDDSKGFVRVESEVDQGSTFALYFPWCEAVEHTSVAPPPSVGEAKERVLVVDDEVVQLRTARRILTHLGYAVIGAQSGDEALKLYHQVLLTDRFDLVIVDMVMPGRLNGLDTIEEIRRLVPSQKALIASGCAPDQMERLVAAQGIPWLAKPYTMGGLASAVRRELESPRLPDLKGGRLEATVSAPSIGAERAGR